MKKGFRTKLLCALIAIFLFVGITVLATPQESKSEKEKTDTQSEVEEEYNKIDWKKYNWYLKWRDFDIEKDYPKNPIIKKYLKMEKEGTLPKNVHIYHNDELWLSESREHLLAQKDIGLEDVDHIKNYWAKDTIKEGIEFWEWKIFARHTNPGMIDFLLWMWEEYKDSPNHLNSSSTGLYMLARAMLVMPKLFKEELIYYKYKAIPAFLKRVKSGRYDLQILEILYRFGYKKFALEKVLEAGKKYQIDFQEWGKHYVSLAHNVRLTIIDPEIEPYALQLLRSENLINQQTQHNALMYLHYLGTINKHLDIIFSIIEEKKYQKHYYQGSYYERKPIDYLEFLFKIKDEKIKDFFLRNHNNPILKEYQSKIDEYLKKNYGDKL